MSHFIYTDLISSLLDPKLVNPGSILIHVDTYGSRFACLYFGLAWTGYRFLDMKQNYLFFARFIFAFLSEMLLHLLVLRATSTSAVFKLFRVPMY